MNPLCAFHLPLARYHTAGLLEGRQATTHWAYYKILEEFEAT
jgi:transcriptional regulator GlxA family with amidase domain